MAKLGEGQSSGINTPDGAASDGQLQQVETRTPGGLGESVGHRFSSRVPKSVAAWLPDSVDIDPEDPDAGSRGD